MADSTETFPEAVVAFFTAINNYRLTKAYVFGNATQEWLDDIKDEYEVADAANVTTKPIIAESNQTPTTPTTPTETDNFDPSTSKLMCGQRYTSRAFELEVNYRARLLNPDPWQALDTPQKWEDDSEKPREAWPPTAGLIAEVIKQMKEKDDLTADKGGSALAAIALMETFARTRLRGKQGMKQFIRQLQSELNDNEVFIRDLQLAVQCREFGVNPAPAVPAAGT